MERVSSADVKRTVLIGAARPQKVPALVCEFSIRRRTKLSLDIVQTYDDPPIPRQTPTGFSMVRFTLPARANYEGLACYLDSDFLALGDVAELFAYGDAQTGEHAWTPKNLQAIFLLDLGYKVTHWKLDEIIGWLDRGERNYGDVMSLKAFRDLRLADLPETWNSLDSMGVNTRMLHLTNMSFQVWRVKDKRAVSRRWLDELRAAIDAGFITRDVVRQEAALGHVIQECAEV